MAVVYTGEFYESTDEYDILCMACKKVVSREKREVLSWLSAKGDPVFCFDCEGLFADVVPEQLMVNDGETLEVYNPTTQTYVKWLRMGSEFSTTLHGRNAIIYSLSSCPYLPKTAKGEVEINRDVE